MKSAALDRNLYVPLYHQLKQLLIADIRSGKLKPQDRLPSEDRVAAEYGVSIITVRRTLNDLATAGYLRRERGRGTFIEWPPVEQGPRELTSFSQEMAKRGLAASSTVLSKMVVEADAEVAGRLRLKEGANVFLLRRLRMADGEPMGIQTAHIPLELAPGLPDEDFASGSLYRILNQRFGLVPTHAREIHSATLIEGPDAVLLRVPDRSVGLRAKRLTFAGDGRPFEFVNSLMHGARYEIVLDLVNNQSGR